MQSGCNNPEAEGPHIDTQAKSIAKFIRTMALQTKSQQPEAAGDNDQDFGPEAKVGDIYSRLRPPNNTLQIAVAQFGEITANYYSEDSTRYGFLDGVIEATCLDNEPDRIVRLKVYSSYKGASPLPSLQQAQEQFGLLQPIAGNDKYIKTYGNEIINVACATRTKDRSEVVLWIEFLWLCHSNSVVS